jgi:hypothetical protein
MDLTRVAWCRAVVLGDVVTGTRLVWSCVGCCYLPERFRGVVVGKLKGIPFTPVIELDEGGTLTLDQLHGVDVTGCVNHGQE